MTNDIVKTSSDIENGDWSTGTAHYTNVVRFGSSSSQASQSSGDICRICHCESDPQNPLLTPCYCSGSLKYVHQTCLQQWLTASEISACELCKFPFIMHTKIKPFNEWRSLDMSGVERRRLCCAVLFHFAAALCVIWSLCILIERAAEEVKRGLIGWPFWTKLAVVTVGLTGGVVFMYIQCRQYLHLCHRWRARNRILLIQNAPEKIHPLSQGSPNLHSRHMPRNSSTGVNGYGAPSNGNNGFNYNMYGYACNASNGDGMDGLNNSLQFGQINQNAVDGSVFDKHNYPNVPLHGKIVANIENYNRDWAIDDSNQISTLPFRQCPPGTSTTQYSDATGNKTAIGTLSEFKNEQSSGSKLDLNIIPNPSSSLSKNSNINNPEKNQINDLDLFKTKTSPTSSSVTAVSTATATAAASTTASINSDAKTGIRPIKNNLFHPLATDLSNNSNSMQYPNSSIFLENRDILNDNDRCPKINYRHSSVLTSPDIADNLDKFLGKDCRRYSDTKLLQTDTIDILNPIFNVALNATNTNNEFRFYKKDKTGRNINSSDGHVTGNVLTSAANSLTGGEQSLMKNILGAPQITDIIFESAKQLDPLELNIQEMLDMDINQHKNYSRKKIRRSLNHYETSKILSELNNGDDGSETYQLAENQDKSIAQNEQQKFDKSRSFFKSLPNLSSSCESLIKK